MIARAEAQVRLDARLLPHTYKSILDTLGDLPILLRLKLNERSHAHELSGECV